MRSPRVIALLLIGLAALALPRCGRAPKGPALEPADAATPPDAGARDAGPAPDDGGLEEFLDDADAGTPLPGPAKLSGTGLYADFAARTVSPEAIPFKPRFQLWSDGAEKQRWLVLPAGTKIDTSDMNNWVFPVGTKAFKEFTRDGVVVETRLLMKLEAGAPGGWFRMAYLWKADGSDALAAPDGMKAALGTGHEVPAQKACYTCHSAVKDVLIGFSAIQLSAADGKGLLSTLAAQGKLTNPPAAEFQPPGSGNVQAALGYLHANCGHCHEDGNALALVRRMRLRLKTTDAKPEETGAYLTTFNAKTSHVMPDGTAAVIVPGRPEQSQLFSRIQIRDASTAALGNGWQMPPFCTRLPDAADIAIVREWILSLP